MFSLMRYANAVMTEDLPMDDTPQPAPTGTVTFLFTDIEGSTRLTQTLGPAYAQLQRDYQRVVRTVCRGWGGYEVDTQGDSFLWAFQRAGDAVAAAVATQKAISQLSAISYQLSNSPPSDPNTQPSLGVRMGLHTGEPTLVDGHYIGLDLNRGARICAAAHGGQVLLSPTTRDLVEGTLPEGITLRDMGEHRLKDLRRSRRLYQLVIPGLQADFPPLRTLNAHRNNLPVQATALVDREAEFKTLRALLTRDSVRLVTLTGPGGVGKTRLALHIGAEMFDTFPDGVFFVPLAPITDPELVLSAIAQAIEIQETAGKSLMESLKAWLKDKRLLLLLDNFEQVTGAGRLITQLLQTAPGVKALVTSRAVLRVYGEQEFQVQPLPLPVADGRWPMADGKVSPSAFSYQLSAISQSPAVQLFVQRAQMVKADFQLTNENAAPVAQICARLDGLPLAIELAAARVKLLSPQAMLTRLDRRLALLTSGSRDLPVRQQTLRASIDWSYDLLDETERAVFRRLAVFVGGFTWEAAEQVIGDSLDLLTELEALVDESLVQQHEDATGETRFLMLETIREYALERLADSGEADALHRRHADYFMRLAEEAFPQLTGADQASWLNRLEREHDNIRVVLQWTKLNSADAMFLKLGNALWLFWYLRGYWTEGRHWLESILSATPSQAAPAAQRELYAKVLNGTATIAAAQKDHVAAETYYKQLLASWQTLNNQRGVAGALGQLGMLAHARSDYSTARRLLEDSVTLLRELGDKPVLSWCLNNLGLVARDQGDYALARALYEESLAIKTMLNDQWSMARLLNNLGEVARDSNDLDAARRFLGRSLAISREVGDKLCLAEVHYNLGQIEYTEGQYTAAQQEYEHSLLIRQDVGDRAGMAHVFRALAQVAVRQADPTQAIAWLEQARTMAQETGNQALVQACELELSTLRVTSLV